MFGRWLEEIYNIDKLSTRRCYSSPKTLQLIQNQQATFHSTWSNITSHNNTLREAHRSHARLTDDLSFLMEVVYSSFFFVM
jgi:hypothetical protein